MTLENQAAFAARHNVSRKTVTSWKARGWLVFEGDQVNVEASNERLRLYRRDGIDKQTTPVTSAVTQGNKAGNTAPLPAERPKVTVGADETNEQAAERLVRAGFQNLPFDEARRVKENYLALLQQLDYEQKAGSLVELETARQVIFEEFRAARDAWLNWPMRVGPLLATDLGFEADKVTEILTEHVHRHISELGEPDANFAEREN